MSSPDQPSFPEEYLRKMNNRPDEDIPGTLEWDDKIIRLADERVERDRAAYKMSRNLGLGLVAVTAAVFGADQLTDFASKEEMVGMLGIFTSSGLGAAIGAQIGLWQR